MRIYESPNNDFQASITYYQDKKECEKSHHKMIHPPIYIRIVKNKIELQSRDGFVESYQNMKTMAKTEFNGKDIVQKKNSFIKTCIWNHDLSYTLVYTSIY